MFLNYWRYVESVFVIMTWEVHIVLTLALGFVILAFVHTIFGES